LVTSTGTYFVKIDDIDAFANFYNDELSTQELCDIITKDIGRGYRDYGAAGAEINFLNQFKNSGLMLFKKGADGSFKRKGLMADGSLQIIPCN